VCSVCSGALVLAAAGLLDGRRATTHWSLCEFMARAFPEVRVEPDPIFVRDGKFAASAGITAGMDLALALLEEDLGREPALAVARWLVLFTRRPGGQAQFSHQLAAEWAEQEPVREVQGWLADHLDEELDVAELARRAGMSPRNFARVFTREVGMTPARYVEAARVEAARQRLERTRQGVDAIAADCGFGSAETLRRAFLRVLKVTPSEYRERFRPVAAE
jgi:transcriptional regulator GlxA family with amidase domain